MDYTLVTRQGCSLCSRAEEALTELSSDGSFSFEAVDVDAHPDLAEYGDDVPVLARGRYGRDDLTVLTRLVSSQAGLASHVRPTRRWWRRRPSS